jgi:hypothetical protein
MAMRIFCVLCVAMFAYLGINKPTYAADIQITMEGAATTTIYGQPLCNNDEKIVFSWRFTPGGTLDTTTQPATFKVILGSNDPKQGVVLQSDNLSVGSGSMGVLEIKGSFTGIPDSKSEDVSKGMFEDGRLTVRDIIGYRRVVIDSGSKPSEAEICKLEAPANGGEKAVELYVVAEYHIVNVSGMGGTTKQTAQGVINVTYDLTPPESPAAPTLFPSEKNIDVRWDRQKDHTYDITVSETKFDPAINPPPRRNTQSISGSTYALSDLKTDVTYYIAIRAYDPAGNPGPYSKVSEGRTVELTDFYEGYRIAGGGDRGFSGGSYCFIATATYGNYDHAFVRVLRQFRDTYLLTSARGREFVAWYYRHSPSWSAQIQGSPTSRVIAQAALLPVVGVAWLLLHPLWLLWGILLLIGFYGVRRWRRLRYAALLVALCLHFCLPSSAIAETPRNFSLELRMGPYKPSIDQETPLLDKSGPYKSFFGDRFLFYIEGSFEWMFFQRFGSLGVAGSVGLTWGTSVAKQGGQALTVQQTDSKSTENAPTNDTTLWIVPLRLDVVYRMDYFAIHNKFPLVPYVRMGIDYYLWFISAPDGGLASYRNSQTNENDSAVGGRLGFHIGLGLQFELNFLDPVAARTFDVEMGVNRTYLFFEWNFSWVGVITPGLNLSDSMFRAGLMFQF